MAATFQKNELLQTIKFNVVDCEQIVLTPRLAVETVETAGLFRQASSVQFCPMSCFLELKFFQISLHIISLTISSNISRTASKIFQNFFTTSHAVHSEYFPIFF